VNVIANGMIDRVSKGREPTNSNLTGCLRRNAVFGYEKMIKDLISNANNIAFQIPPASIISIFIAGWERY
jgi:hypothetical protein